MNKNSRERTPIHECPKGEHEWVALVKDKNGKQKVWFCVTKKDQNKAREEARSVARSISTKYNIGENDKVELLKSTRSDKIPLKLRKGTNRKQFLEKEGFDCGNHRAWSFRHQEKEVIAFALWEHSKDKKILDEEWKLNERGRKSGNYTISLKHIELIEKEGFQLRIFSQKAKKAKEGSSPSTIESFIPCLCPKYLIKKGNAWYAEDKPSNYKDSNSPNLLKKRKPRRRSSENKHLGDQIRKTPSYKAKVSQTHNRLQMKVKECLSSRYKQSVIKMEEDYVDIKMEEKTQITLYEVKTGGPISCIKEGLGQLLSYCWDLENKEKKVRLVIVGPNPPDKEEKEFIDFIKGNLSIDFEYKQCS